MKTIKDVVIRFNGLWQECFDVGFPPLGLTRQEFEAEAKRMGYINGYKFMEECTEKGKPNLPDDVMVSVMTHGRGRLPAGHVGFWNWNSSEIKSFRIVDPRYKPVDEVSEIAESINKAEYVSELRDNKPFDRKVSGFVKAAANKIVDDIMKKEPIGMSEKKWHERGELPPVGSFFDYVVGSHHHRTNVIHEHNGLVWLDGIGLVKFDPEKFRPIKTHREKVIEAVDSLIHDYQAGAEIRTEFLNVLYDAEMLVLPQDSGDTE